MKKLSILISLASCLISFSFNKAHAMSQKIPNSYWSCTFLGMEEYARENRVGIQHLELRSFLAGSDWLPTKDEAYSAAKKECESYSVKECSLSGCTQKGELR